MPSANPPVPQNVEKTLCRILVPATAFFMIVVTGVAVILGGHVFATTQGNQDFWCTVHAYAPIVFWTGLAEGLCLLTGFCLFRLLSRKITRPVAALAAAVDRLTASGKTEHLPVDGEFIELNRLARAFNRLFAAQEARLAELRDLTTNILHDIRTPLTQITGDAEAVCTGECSAPEAAARSLTACRTILRLIDTNAEIARVNADDRMLAPHNVDLTDLVREATDLFSAAAAEKTIRLSSRTPDHPLLFCGHLDRLQRLVGNLIDNAVKFTPANGTITVELLQQPHAVVLRVADTGIGMTDETRQRIFERFFRADTSRQTAGFGLGLSLVQALVLFYHGTIAVESQLSRGTTFTVTLPTDSTETPAFRQPRDP